MNLKTAPEDYPMENLILIRRHGWSEWFQTQCVLFLCHFRSLHHPHNLAPVERLSRSLRRMMSFRKDMVFKGFR